MTFGALQFEDGLRLGYAMVLEAEIWDWTTKDLCSLAVPGPVRSMG